MSAPPRPPRNCALAFLRRDGVTKTVKVPSLSLVQDERHSLDTYFRIPLSSSPAATATKGTAATTTQTQKEQQSPPPLHLFTTSTARSMHCAKVFQCGVYAFDYLIFPTEVVMNPSTAEQDKFYTTTYVSKRRQPDSKKLAWSLFEEIMWMAASVGCERRSSTFCPSSSASSQNQNQQQQQQQQQQQLTLVFVGMTHRDELKERLRAFQQQQQLDPLDFFGVRILVQDTLDDFLETWRKEVAEDLKSSSNVTMTMTPSSSTADKNENTAAQEQQEQQEQEQKQQRATSATVAIFLGSVEHSITNNNFCQPGDDGVFARVLTTSNNNQDRICAGQCLCLHSPDIGCVKRITAIQTAGKLSTGVEEFETRQDAGVGDVCFFALKHHEEFGDGGFKRMKRMKFSPFLGFVGSDASSFRGGGGSLSTRPGEFPKPASSSAMLAGKMHPAFPPSSFVASSPPSSSSSSSSSSSLPSNTTTNSCAVNPAVFMTLVPLVDVFPNRPDNNNNNNNSGCFASYRKRANIVTNSEFFVLGGWGSCWARTILRRSLDTGRVHRQDAKRWRPRADYMVLDVALSWQSDNKIGPLYFPLDRENEINNNIGGNSSSSSSPSQKFEEMLKRRLMLSGDVDDDDDGDDGKKKEGSRFNDADRQIMMDLVKGRRCSLVMVVHATGDDGVLRMEPFVVVRVATTFTLPSMLIQNLLLQQQQNPQQQQNSHADPTTSTQQQQSRACATCKSVLPKLSSMFPAFFREEFSQFGKFSGHREAIEQMLVLAMTADNSATYCYDVATHDRVVQLALAQQQHRRLLLLPFAAGALVDACDPSVLHRTLASLLSAVACPDCSEKWLIEYLLHIETQVVSAGGGLHDTFRTKCFPMKHRAFLFLNIASSDAHSHGTAGDSKYTSAHPSRMGFLIGSSLLNRRAMKTLCDANFSLVKYKQVETLELACGHAVPIRHAISDYTGTANNAFDFLPDESDRHRILNSLRHWFGFLSWSSICEMFTFIAKAFKFQYLNGLESSTMDILRRAQTRPHLTATRSLQFWLKSGSESPAWSFCFKTPEKIEQRIVWMREFLHKTSHKITNPFSKQQQNCLQIADFFTLGKNSARLLQQNDSGRVHYMDLIVLHHLMAFLLLRFSRYNDDDDACCGGGDTLSIVSRILGFAVHSVEVDQTEYYRNVAKSFLEYVPSSSFSSSSSSSSRPRSSDDEKEKKQTDSTKKQEVQQPQQAAGQARNVKFPP